MLYFKGMKPHPNRNNWWSLLKKAFRGEAHDYTKGNLSQAIFLLAVPMVFEMLMESIFALVDIYYVSQVSTNAVATVGLTESVITLIYAVAVGISMAATALVARRIGEGDAEGAKNAASQVIYLGIGVSVIFSIIGIYFAKDILSLMHAAPDLIEEGYAYTQILIGGNVTIVLLFLINAIFRGAGNAAYAMWVLVVSNSLNIVLDPLFIFGWGPIPEMGMKGAAIATTLGRGTAVVMQLILLWLGKSRVQLAWQHLKLQWQIVSKLIRLSWGGIGQFLIGTSSWVFLMRIMSEFGSEVLAGYTIAIRILMFSLMPAWGLSNAAATLVGQNLGAHAPDRAERAVWQTGKYNALFMGLVSLLSIFYAPTIVGFFATDSFIIDTASLCLRVFASGYVFYAFGMVMIQSFNGAGDTQTPTYINFFCFWLFQIPFAYFTALHLEWGILGVLVAIVLSEILLTLISGYLFRRGHWKNTQV